MTGYSEKKFETIEDAQRTKSQPNHGLCDWFLLCANNAVRNEPHPVLGDVAVCQRCSDFIHAEEIFHD